MKVVYEIFGFRAILEKNNSEVFEIFFWLINKFLINKNGPNLIWLFFGFSWGERRNSFSFA